MAVVSRGVNPVGRLYDFLTVDFKQAPLTSYVHLLQCALVVACIGILLFAEARPGGWGRPAAWGPMAGFVLEHCKYFFTGFFLLGFAGYFRDENREVAVKVLKLGFLCAFLTWLHVVPF